MAKIDLDALGIEEPAALRDNATDKLTEKVATRQAELEAESERLSQYGKTARKSSGASAVVETRRSDEVARKIDEAKEPVVEAARNGQDRHRQSSVRRHIEMVIRPVVLYW